MLGFFGFVLGALLTSSVDGDRADHVDDRRGAIVGGIVGALILVAAYFVGVALIGAGVGALVVNLIWASLGREPHIVDRDPVRRLPARSARSRCSATSIIVATGFGGAWTAIVGGLALMGDRLAVEAAARNNVWLAYPMNPAPGQRWVVVAWLALGLTGVIVQLDGHGQRKEISQDLLTTTDGDCSTTMA